MHGNSENFLGITVDFLQIENSRCYLVDKLIKIKPSVNILNENLSR